MSSESSESDIIGTGLLTETPSKVTSSSSMLRCLGALTAAGIRMTFRNERSLETLFKFVRVFRGWILVYVLCGDDMKKRRGSGQISG